MGGLTFLEYVKELPKGKREAKGATKGGYATSQKKPAAPAATANGSSDAAAVESTTRGLPAATGVEEAKGGAAGGGGGSEADAIADKITAKVWQDARSVGVVAGCCGCCGP